MDDTGKDPLIGTRLREYEILDILGKGGMGAVYRARHVYLEEERAIKVIHSVLVKDQEFIDRFIREAKILTRLRHPNLVEFFEFGTLGEEGFFMVLELLSGESLSARLEREKTIPIQQSVKIIREAALGLHSAHLKGVVHRDVSPDNIFLAKDGSGADITKVIDFGIAKPNMESTRSLTMANMFIGKPQFCSPEQCGALQEGEEIDARSDIYSLGVTLYFLVAGKLPFYAATPQGYIFKHMMEEPVPVSTLVPTAEYPKALDPIIAKTLAKKREDRYATMEEFARDLEQLSWANVVTKERPPETVSFSAGLNSGEFFAGRYLIEKPLGEGGMGAVYKATDTMLNIPVALKTINAKFAQNQGALERLKREVILARKVSHPNACRIYDIGESGGIHYVSMEYLQGRTLADMIKEKRLLSPETGVSILQQVLSALKTAHDAGVIHRDLKPENIMVDFKNRASIMDFGISFSSEIDKITRTGVVVGTPYYMAPEQLGGQEIDHRADLYSVGVIMFQMFTGRLPFTGKSPFEVIAAHMKSDFPKPSKFVPDIPPALEKVILKALSKDPVNRYQTAEDLLEAIRSWKDGLSENIATIAQVLPTAETLEKAGGETIALTTRRFPVVWMAVGVALLVSALSAWFYFYKRTPPPAPAPRMVSVVVNALPWAHVSVAPASQNASMQVPVEENVTPCSWLLSPGEYQVTLSSDDGSKPVVKQIQVKTGETNFFEFQMPAYDPKAIQALLGAEP